MQPPLPQCLLGSACSSFYTLPFSCHSILFLHVPSEQEETCSPWLLGLLCVRGELRTVDSNREARGSLAGNCFLCQSCSASICLTGRDWEDWTLVCFLPLEEKYLAECDLSLSFFCIFPCWATFTVTAEPLCCSGLGGWAGVLDGCVPLLGSGIQQEALECWSTAVRKGSTINC